MKKKFLLDTARIAAVIVVVGAVSLFAAGEEAQINRAAKGVLETVANIIGWPLAIWGLIRWLASNSLGGKSDPSEGLMALFSGIGIALSVPIVNLVMRVAGVATAFR